MTDERETIGPGAPRPVWRRVLFPAMAAVSMGLASWAFWATGGLRLADEPGGPTAIVVGPVDDGPFKGFRMVPERPAPDFTLTGAGGAPVTLADARGKVVLLFFGFTSCPDVCPLALEKIAAALGELGADADRVQVVFVSVDPERDTPDVIARYVAAFDPRIVGATGDTGTLERVAESYGVRFWKEFPAGAATDTADYSMAHSSTVFFIDAFGQLRSSFIEPYSPSDLAHDVGVLLDEAG